MRSAILSICLVPFASLLYADTPYPNIAPTDPKTPAEELKTFKVPEGFEVQLVASEPDIRKPIQMCFDAKGRLWVTTSEEYPHPAVGRPGKDRLYVLEDFGADGKARKVSIFADDLNIPIGVVPLPDCKSVIVSSIDTADKRENLQCWIWKLTDTDGDGKYDKKEKLYGPFGCRDTHGMNNSYTLMPDGWIYACHGYLNDSKPKGKDGHEISMNSGNTFRFRPDGSRIEIWTRGQVNPFGIAVDPYFNLYTADCHSKPITQLIRGATYQSFSKPHDGLGFAPHVTIHGHDSTALCGLVYYAADHFPKEYLDHMFLGNVTSNCINWDKIEFKGSTPVAIDKDKFLASTDLWCRPTDIKLGPDGALYWADFYNKIIGHYEVGLDHPGRDKLRGRVWRIIWKGKDGKGEAPKMPDLHKAAMAQVVKDLGDRNLTVRLLATNQLILRRNEFGSIPPTKPGIDGTDIRAITEFGHADATSGGVHLLWGLFNDLDKPPAVRLAQNIMSSKLSSFWLVHEIRMAATLNEWDLTDVQSGLRSAIISALSNSDPFVRRAAVESLISHPHVVNLRPLVKLELSAGAKDDHLRYATRVALRESLRPLEDWDKAAGKTEWTTEQLKALADIAPAVPNNAASQFLATHFKELANTGRLSEFVQHSARYAPYEKWVGFIRRFACEFKPDDVKLSIELFQAFQRGRQQAGENVLANEEALLQAEKLLLKALSSSDPNVLQAGIDLANATKLHTAFEPLGKLAEARERAEPQRIAALGGLAALDAAKSVPILAKFLNDSAASIAVREKAAQSLASLNRADAQDELVKALAAAPARLQSIIALAMAGNINAAEKLLKAVQEGKASARLLQDKSVQTRLNESKVSKANERIALLTKGLPTADQKMLDLMKQRSGAFAKAKPDAVLGKAIFTKNCAICHQIGNEGTKIGPQLDGIGGRGLDRLLEDILDPNRNVDIAFRQTTLLLKDGKSVAGLLLREEGQIVVMADEKGKEVRVPKDDIDEKRSSLLSPMPANLSEALPEKDFHDLMAYLLTQRAKEKNR